MVRGWDFCHRKQRVRQQTRTNKKENSPHRPRGGRETKASLTLGARFTVTPAGKSGTSCKFIARDAEVHLNQCTKGMVSKQYYTYILVVLGTNDIPRANQWDKQQHVLRKAMERVLAGLADYLSPTGPGGGGVRHTGVQF